MITPDSIHSFFTRRKYRKLPVCEKCNRRHYRSSSCNLCSQFIHLLIPYKVSRFFCVYSRLTKWLVKYVHARKDVVYLQKTWHTSYTYEEEHGVTEIPKGEQLIFYQWRGHWFRFWNGKLISIDPAVHEGIKEEWWWDPVYDPAWLWKGVAEVMPGMREAMEKVTK